LKTERFGVGKIKSRLEEHSKTMLPKRPLSKAIDYTLNH
jgi:hypothetical protein